MKHLALIAALFALAASATAAQSSGQSSLRFSDGAVATGYDHCGEGDLSAKVVYPDGDALLFFSEGAALDQPYYAHVVRTHLKQTLFEYSRRLESRGTILTLDHGRVHLTIYVNTDGTLHFIFSSALGSGV